MGLKLLKELKIKKVCIYGDSDLVINQVKGVYQAKHFRMMSYTNLDLYLLEDIQEHQLIVIPREHNVIADALAVFASLSKILIHANKKYEIQVKHRPTVPDNVKYWQVFEDDQHVNRFLTTSQEFENCVIDDENVAKQDEEDAFINHIADHEIVQLKNNMIPKGLVPLEELFDNNYVAKNPKVTPNNVEVEDYNICIKVAPKIIKISQSLTLENKEKYIKLMKEFFDVFAWSYKDLKVYDTRVIQHTIPVKENEKPFKQKLRRVNPLLLPLIEKEIKSYLMQKLLFP